MLCYIILIYWPLHQGRDKTMLKCIWHYLPKAEILTWWRRPDCGSLEGREFAVMPCWWNLPEGVFGIAKISLLGCRRKLWIELFFQREHVINLVADPTSFWIFLAPSSTGSSAGETGTAGASQLGWENFSSPESSSNSFGASWQRKKYLKAPHPFHWSVERYKCTTERLHNWHRHVSNEFRKTVRVVIERLVY